MFRSEEGALRQKVEDLRRELEAEKERSARFAREAKLERQRAQYREQEAPRVMRTGLYGTVTPTKRASARPPRARDPIETLMIGSLIFIAISIFALFSIH